MYNNDKGTSHLTPNSHTLNLSLRKSITPAELYSVDCHVSILLTHILPSYLTQYVLVLCKNLCCWVASLLYTFHHNMIIRQCRINNTRQPYYHIGIITRGLLYGRLVLMLSVAVSVSFSASNFSSVRLLSAAA